MSFVGSAVRTISLSSCHIIAHSIGGYQVCAKWLKDRKGRVPLAKIIENHYSLAPGRYKPVTVEAVNYDLPADILREVHKLEGEITDQGKALLASVGVGKV